MIVEFTRPKYKHSTKKNNHTYQRYDINIGTTGGTVMDNRAKVCEQCREEKSMSFTYENATCNEMNN